MSIALPIPRHSAEDIADRPMSMEEVLLRARALKPAPTVVPFPDPFEPFGWDLEPEPYPFWKDEQ